jgi:hypothetical protein
MRSSSTRRVASAPAVAFGAHRGSRASLFQAGQILGNPPVETRRLLGDLPGPMIRFTLAAARNFEPSSPKRRALNNHP